MLQGLRIAPASTTTWSPPPYATLSRFDEHDVTVGPAPLPSRAQCNSLDAACDPALCFSAGAGLFDRDETSGQNKPLKDLAWGLASRGVSVLRFDKVTYVHNSQVANVRDFTMVDEYVPHAAAAIRILQHLPTVDPAKVFILGHSMGGKVAPRVASAETSIAGLVILAGDAQPMHHAAIRVADGLTESRTRRAGCRRDTDSAGCPDR